MSKNTNCGCFFPWNRSNYSVIDISSNIPNPTVQDPSSVVQDPSSAVQDPSSEPAPAVQEPASPEIWEEEFFKRFEWLKSGSRSDQDDDHERIDINDFLKMQNSLSFYGEASNESFDENMTIDDIVVQNNKKLKKICKVMESMLTDFDKMTSDSSNLDPSTRTLYLYFVALEEDKMLLHASFKRSYEEVLVDCEILYEYAKIYKPKRVVYVSENIDLYDVDKNVKIFMNMFGIDDTRGGSYTDVVLSEHVKQVLEAEFKTADIDFYVNQERIIKKTL